MNTGNTLCFTLLGNRRAASFNSVSTEIIRDRSKAVWNIMGMMIKFSGVRTIHSIEWIILCVGNNIQHLGSLMDWELFERDHLVSSLWWYLHLFGIEYSVHIF